MNFEARNVPKSQTDSTITKRHSKFKMENGTLQGSRKTAAHLERLKEENTKKATNIRSPTGATENGQKTFSSINQSINIYTDNKIAETSCLDSFWEK